MYNRKLNQAIRCQLLTGSFEGKTVGCPCLCSKDCKFTDEEREKLKSHKKLQKALKRNQEEFRNVTN